jgi:hypothetical protein
VNDAIGGATSGTLNLTQTAIGGFGGFSGGAGGDATSTLIGTNPFGAKTYNLTANATGGLSNGTSFGLGGRGSANATADATAANGGIGNATANANGGQSNNDGGAATANASVTNGGSAVAQATGGNGSFNGGAANATATSTAMLGGTANASATATGGGGTFAGPANANSFATTINGNAAQAKSTATGSGGGQAQATAQTNFGNFQSVQSMSASPLPNSYQVVTSAIAQTGGVVSLSNPIIPGQSFSVVSGSGFGPLTVANGSMGAGFGGIMGVSITYKESVSFTQIGGNFVLDLLSNDALGKGFDSALFTISLNNVVINSQGTSNNTCFRRFLP